MKWWCSVSAAVLAASSLVSAQSTAMMGKTTMAERMGMEETYVGCVEAGSTPGSFVLTNVSRDAMSDASMPKDTMPKDTMNNDMMKKDAMMKHDGDAMDDMRMPMAPNSVMLVGSAVSKKYVGRKVSVAGSATMGPQTSLTVKSVKVVAKSCS